MGALLLQKYETRICVCTQWIAMLCGSVICQIRFALQHMHSFFECQWKLHAFIVGRPAVESQVILYPTAYPIILASENTLAGKAVLSRKQLYNWQNHQAFKILFNIVTDFTETFQKAFEIQRSKIMYAAPYSGYKAVGLLLRHDVHLCISLFWGLSTSKN